MVLPPENSTPRERSEAAGPGAEIFKIQWFEEKGAHSAGAGIPLALEDRYHDDRRNGGRLLQDGPDPGTYPESPSPFYWADGVRPPRIPRTNSISSSLTVWPMAG